MDPVEEIIYELVAKNARTRADFVSIVGKVYKEHKFKGYYTNIRLRETYDLLVAEGKIEANENVENLLITKKMRSTSGVSIITVLTKPYDCPGKCIYCPTEDDVPKSYLSDEPAVMRAILNEYDPKRQVENRLESLVKQGHPVDKVELIVIGGTFNYLPRDYQEEFIKACFDGLNGTVSEDLTEAKLANEKAKSRCVGLTVETRPDYITAEEIAWFRYLGATRVELGVQSIFDKILELNARGSTNADTANATRLLKNGGFKITYHIMPNLFGSSIEEDKITFDEVFNNEKFKPDYIKIYPCMVLKGTPLYDLWQRGEYHSYTDEELIDLIKYVKKTVPCWIRIMRTIRDIPSRNISSGSVTSNMRQMILEMAKNEGWACKCVRCREVGGATVIAGEEVKLFEEKYDASGGTEYFLSFESGEKEVLYSLLRLRLPFGGHPHVISKLKEAEHQEDVTENKIVETYDQEMLHDSLYKYLPELENTALIREVHTYGQQIEIGEKGETQHKGFGRRLIERAEKIAKENGYKKIAVISGVGVREYYRKYGYELVGEYMIKNL